MHSRVLLAAALAALSVALPARAEISELVVAQQYGVSFLPLMLMERNKAVEGQAQKAGMPVPKVTWQTVAGPSVINDGLVSGAINFAATGAPSLVTFWAKTRGANGIRGVAATTSYPLYLNVRNPKVQSLKDFTDADKIAVPSVKVSTQAIVLQMAAAQAFGQAEYARLDPMTVSLSHPDGLLALISGTAGVNAHFTSSPFHEQEIKIPGVRTLFTSYDILGGRASAIVITTSTRFRDANPMTYKAFLAGLKETIDGINADKPAAAKAYLEMTHDTKTSLAEITQIIADPGYAYTLTPEKVFKTAAFMYDIGTIKQKPENWKDLFFPDIYDLPGD